MKLVFKYKIMKTINTKEYYTREELDEIVYSAIRKNAKELAEEIKKESKFRNTNEVVYV